MAVQFNLLPDVKLEFNRAQHTKRVVYTISVLACLVAVALFIISFLAVNVLQKKLLDNANNDITTYSDKLKSINDLDKILTIQNQLVSLPGLHDQKHYGSRLFQYVQEVTPANVFIGKFDIDTTALTFEIDGTSNSVESVNKFVDTLKYTTYLEKDSNSPKNAFNSVVLSKINRDDSTGNAASNTSYTINCNFDPALFTGANPVTLTVPSETTTRSVLNAPTPASPLFNGETGKPTKTQQGSQ